MRKYKEDNMQPKSILSKYNATSRRSSWPASVSIDPATYVNYPEDQRPSFRLPQRMTSRHSTIFPATTLCWIGMPSADDWEDQDSVSIFILDFNLVQSNIITYCILKKKKKQHSLGTKETMRMTKHQKWRSRGGECVITRTKRRHT